MVPTLNPKLGNLIAYHLRADGKWLRENGKTNVRIRLELYCNNVRTATPSFITCLSEIENNGVHFGRFPWDIAPLADRALNKKRVIHYQFSGKDCTLYEQEVTRARLDSL
jgi:hypothetical protein